MAPNRPSSFGKAKPAQAPKYMVREDELDSCHDDPVFRKEPVHPRSTSTFILSIICLTCVLCLGGMGVLYLLNSPTEVQAMQVSNQHAKLDGAEQFAKKYKDCKIRSWRGVNKKTKKFRTAVNEATKSFGQPSITGNPKLVLCLSESRRKYFCNEEFRREFNTHVSDFHSSYLATNQMARDMSSMFQSVNEGEPVINYLDRAERKIRILFKSGHLRRAEFSGFFSGEPKWLKQLFEGSEQVPPPC